MRGREIIAWGVVIAGLLFLVPSVRDGCGAPAIRPGDPVPAFSLVSATNGGTWDSESLRGRPYALLFFATWCGSCRSELPAVARILQERPTLRLIAVSDEPGDRVARYLASSGLVLPAAGGGGGMFASFGVRAVPTMVVVDAGGVISFARAGSGAVFEGIRRLGDASSRTGRTQVTDASSAAAQMGSASRPRRRPRPGTPRMRVGRQASGGLMGCLRDQEGGKHVNRMSCRDTPSTCHNAEAARSIPRGMEQAPGSRRRGHAEDGSDR